MTTIANTIAAESAAVIEAEYHPEVASKGIDHTFGAAVKATRKGGAPANAITAKAKAPRSRKAPAAPAEPTLAEQESTLRTAWDTAHSAEGTAKNMLDAAKIGFENTRVIKCRIAFATAMLTPNAEGKANLLNAARILGTDTEATPAERTAKAKGRKNSLRNYVAAGVELDDKGMANRTAEPDAEERKIVADVFRAGNKRNDTDGEGGTGGEGEGEGEGGTTPPADDEAVTYVHLVAHVAGLNSVLKMLKAGSVPVSEREASNMADMLANFQMELDAYSAGV